MARAPLVAVLSLALAAACSGKKKKPTPAPAPSPDAAAAPSASARGGAEVDVRCERLLGAELREKYFPGRRLEKGNEAPAWSRTCAISPPAGKPGQVGTTIQISCGKDYVTDETMAQQREAALKQGFRPIDGVGRFAARRQGELRLWDRDAPCFFLVHAFTPPEKLADFARDLEASTTAGSYHEP